MTEELKQAAQTIIRHFDHEQGVSPQTLLSIVERALTQQATPEQKETNNVSI